ncbi:MAG TPA: VIT1/CCC1 transporter family protein [Stellaceae bacterium]|jgi:VIT1/CCC1 family predicted Fe2+/Mn2+ transporter
MTDTAILPRLKHSLIASAGTVVFGMEDGTVSIFGLVFGVAATTNSSVAVLVAGASGAAAAAVSMMAGAFLESETDRDEKKARQTLLETDLRCDPAGVDTMLGERLKAVGLEAPLAAALAGAVRDKPDAIRALLMAMQGGTDAEVNPLEQALWMLVADFFSAAVPIVPFMLMPVAAARIVSATITILLLTALGAGRGKIGKRSIIHTIIETVSVGIAAALAGVGIGLLFNSAYGG